MGYERISLYDVSTLFLAYLTGCMLTVFCCAFETLCRWYSGRRRPTVHRHHSKPRKVQIDLQPVDGEDVVRFEYLLKYEIDFIQFKQDVDAAVRRNYVTRI